MLARVGEEKSLARAMRSGSPADGDFARRLRECLELYAALVPLRFSRLVAELGSEVAAQERMRAEARYREHEQEEALIRIQTRVYGTDREQAKA